MFAPWRDAFFFLSEFESLRLLLLHPRFLLFPLDLFLLLFCIFQLLFGIFFLLLSLLIVLIFAGVVGVFDNVSGVREVLQGESEYQLDVLDVNFFLGLLLIGDGLGLVPGVYF